MPTKLSRYCEGILEAAWLAAVILIPIYFNIYSSRIFEPDKIAILRSLALLMLGAWVVKLVNEGGFRWERLQPAGSPFKFITKIPLVALVIALAILYVVSTIFSVTWRVSLLGSYQRLQGTYTTLSYLIIFFSMVANLRTRAQVERLITTIVIASLPIALYGILQRYKIDPIPWGGDTSRRIASSMGNSIFVAAYLIMVFPLTIGRVVQSFNAILKDESEIWSQVARATVYVFTAAIQLIAIYSSGSRGPALGLMAGAFFMFLLLSMYWQRRWLTLTIIFGAIFLSVFLVVFNIPDGPLERLRTSPAVGRFGHLLDPDSDTALVRKYIWQGAAELVSIHEPLEYPDGTKDSFNLLRPLIGYGPESMYVANNPFYVPELAQIEKRNASPDRSHNETWDALVITGVFGIVIYLSLFTLVFYYGLKWLGLISGQKQRNIFLILCLGIGLVGGVGFGIWRGVEYLGVGIPFGMLIGLLIYLALVAVFVSYTPSRTPGGAKRSLTMIMLIAAIVSHYVEINFGIAIVSTRTYFWVYTGLLLGVGYILPKYGEYDRTSLDRLQSQDTKAGNNQKQGSNIKRKRHRGQTSSSVPITDRLVGIRETMITGLITSIILISLGYNFISNPRGLTSTLSVMWTSVTRLPNQGNAVSYGILMMFITTWIALLVVMTSEVENKGGNTAWWGNFAQAMFISLAVGLFYWLWHAGGLAALANFRPTTLDEILNQVISFESLLTQFYIFLLFLLLVLSLFISERWPIRARIATTLGGISAIVALLVVIVMTSYTNLRVIQADIAFKLADPFTRDAQWPVAISIYQRANQLAPNEDFYYLFLGRAYLEHSKTMTNVDERDKFISQSEEDLRTAQSINPLNTDHTANLARLFSLWASYETDQNTRVEKAEKSSDYFSRAVTLSPNNAKIWDEWALVSLNLLQDSDGAYQRLSHASEIDPEYHWTYALLGEYHSRQASQLSEQDEVRWALENAAENYAKALDLPTPGEPQSKYNYALALGGIYTKLGHYDDAIKIYAIAIEEAPKGEEIWRIEEVMAGLSVQTGDLNQALHHIYNALNLSPDDQKERLQSLLNQLEHTQP